MPSISSLPSTSTQGRYPSVPVQTYSPRPIFQYAGWNRLNWFLYQLTRRYDYLLLRGDYYLWRYAQGDSPLTQETVTLALADSKTASNGLVRLADDLKRAVEEYRAGTIPATVFEAEVRNKTDLIRKLAKKVRKDQFIDYLDQRKRKQDSKFSTAKSPEDLLKLADEMCRLAREVDHGVGAYMEKDLTRVVDVSELQQPSLDSLSKGIDRLAKTIKKSADHL